jgi:hypothetical protein
LSASSGISTKDVTSIFNVLGSNSKKIAVTSADGVTETYVEIERWDYTGTPSTSSAWLWAKLPRITANENTYFYLYFDGSHADNTTYVGDTTSTPAKNVWTSSYISVYHLAELGSATIDEYKDSTVNSYDGQGGSGSIKF